MTNNVTTEEICIFLKPVYWDKTDQLMKPVNSEISKSETWNFSEISCNSTTTNEMIEFISDNNSSSFYLTKDFSYGEIFLLFFLTIFTLFFIFGFILKFINKEKVSFRG